MSAQSAIDDYVVEALDLLAEIDKVASSLEPNQLGVNQPNADKLNHLFRAFHTIKGAGLMCGLRNIANFTHHVETLLDLAREGKIPVSPEFIHLILRSEDQIAALIAVEEGQEEPNPAATEKLIHDLYAHAGLPVPTHHEARPLTSEDETVFLFS